LTKESLTRLARGREAGSVEQIALGPLGPADARSYRSRRIRALLRGQRRQPVLSARAPRMTSDGTDLGARPQTQAHHRPPDDHHAHGRPAARKPRADRV